MITHDKGRYVLFEDYAALDKLCKKLMKQHSDISCENIMLRKAGDDLIVALDKRDDCFDNSDKRQAIADWNAAKEGKPTV